MKLNKFFEKNRARKTVKKVISFTNEKRDKEFQIQIDDLTSQLSRYKDIEKNNDRLNNAKHEYEKDRKGLVGEINDLKQENKTFELEIETLTPKATAMEDTIKSSNQYQEQLKQLQHDIESYKRSRIQQDKNINLLSKERSEFQIDLKDVEKKYNQEKKTHLDVANLYQQLKKEYNNLLGFSQENSKISIEQKNKINDLTVKLDFLEADAAGARVKMEQAEKDVRRRRARFTAGKTFTGNTYNTLLANYYRSEADYRNTVLGNIQQNKFQFNRTMEALSTQYDAQSTYVTAPNFMYTAGASALSFAGDYYSYKAKKNAGNVNDDYYGYEEKTEYNI